MIAGAIDPPQKRREQKHDPAIELNCPGDLVKWNTVSRFVAFNHASRLQLKLLVLSVLLLIGQICWPAVAHWWRLPGPGQTGLDTVQATTLASDFLIQLPPAYYETKLWPLVVFLHGSGQCGSNPNILRSETVFHQSLRAIIAAPQCLPSCSWQPDAVADLVKYIASRYRVDRKRIYLVGHSMGGYGAWKTAALHTDLFAAIVPISGGGEPNDAKSLARISIWAFHGDKDKVVPVAETEQMVEAVRNAGGQPRVTILSGAGHGISRSVCERSDLWNWLLQQYQNR